MRVALLGRLLGRASAVATPTRRAVRRVNQGLEIMYRPRRAVSEASKVCAAIATVFRGEKSRGQSSGLGPALGISYPVLVAGGSLRVLARRILD